VKVVPNTRRTRIALSLTGGALAVLAAVSGAAAPAAATPGANDDKPKVSLRASPSVAFSPARIYLVAELRGGANDYQEYYCADVEWDWGDDTRSTSSADCEPYEKGKSEIKRRFAVTHEYKVAGTYRIQFRLMRKREPIVATSTTVRIREGIGGER